MLLRLAKLFLACLVAGLALSVLDVDALGFLRILARATRALLDQAAGFLSWALEYVVVGAVVVVPTYLIWLAIGVLRRGRAPR